MVFRLPARGCAVLPVPQGTPRAPVVGPRDGGSANKTMISRKFPIKIPTRKVSHEPKNGIQSELLSICIRRTPGSIGEGPRRS